MGKIYLNDIGLSYLWGKIKSFFVSKEDGKGLSTNDYTTAEKNKLAGLSNYDDTDIKSRLSTIEEDYIKSYYISPPPYHN